MTPCLSAILPSACGRLFPQSPRFLPIWAIYDPVMFGALRANPTSRLGSGLGRLSGAILTGSFWDAGSSERPFVHPAKTTAATWSMRDFPACPDRRKASSNGRSFISSEKRGKPMPAVGMLWMQACEALSCNYGVRASASWWGREIAMFPHHLLGLRASSEVRSTCRVREAEFKDRVLVG